MAKLVAPDRGVRGVDIDTPRGRVSYNPGKDGLIEVNNPRHAAQLKSEGFFAASSMGITRAGIGYQCAKCGFASWFKKCSRCENVSP